MRIFKKHEKVIAVDENGNPIEPEKKGRDWKKIGRDVLIGTISAAAGIAVFCLVLVAGNTSSGDSSGDDSSNGDDGVIDFPTMEPTGTENASSSGSEE